MLLLALALLLGRAAPALAQAAGRENTVLLSVAAPPEDAAKLEAVARELLERLEMQVELRRLERIDLREIRRPLRRSEAYFARVWIGFDEAGRARLYLEHAARDRVLVRDVASGSNNPELVREELGHILQTAVEGLKAGEEIGAPRGEALDQVEAETGAGQPEPATPSREPERAAPPRQRRAFRFGPRYEGVWLGGGAHFEDGPAAVFGYTLPGARYGFELHGLYRRPLHVDAAPVGARMQTLGGRLLLGFEAWRSQRALLRLAAGVGADLVRVSPFASAGSDVELARSHWLRLALGRLSLTYARQLAPWLAFELTLGADLDPGRTRYVYQASAGEAGVLEPWPVRPFVALGATVP